MDKGQKNSETRLHLSLAIALAGLAVGVVALIQIGWLLLTSEVSSSNQAFGCQV